MKKIILLLLLLGCTFNSFGQQIGKTKIEVEGQFDKVDLDDFYNKWIESETSYIINFKKNPIGIKNAVEKMKSILYYNNLSFTNPEINSNYLASYVKNIEDYESLDSSIYAGSSEVRMSWFVNDKALTLVLKDSHYWIICSK